MDQIQFFFFFRKFSEVRKKKKKLKKVKKNKGLIIYTKGPINQFFDHLIVLGAFLDLNSEKSNGSNQNSFWIPTLYIYLSKTMPADFWNSFGILVFLRVKDNICLKRVILAIFEFDTKNHYNAKRVPKFRWHSLKPFHNPSPSPPFP